jgi:hypothetical protein
MADLWKKDPTIKPPFLQGEMLELLDNLSTHWKKGDIITVSGLEKTGGEWFVHMKEKCHSSNCEPTKSGGCGGWYAYHFKVVNSSTEPLRPV